MSATSSSGKPSEVTVEDDVIFQQQMGNRTILLNRPKKLNSLDLSMIRKILQRLKVCSNVFLGLTLDMGEIRFEYNNRNERSRRESVLCGW
jgi:hypothetical protein